MLGSYFPFFCACTPSTSRCIAHMHGWLLPEALALRYCTWCTAPAPLSILPCLHCPPPLPPISQSAMGPACGCYVWLRSSFGRARRKGCCAACMGRPHHSAHCFLVSSRPTEQQGTQAATMARAPATPSGPAPPASAGRHCVSTRSHRHRHRTAP